MGKFTVGLCDDALSHFGNTDDLTFLVYLRLSHTKLPKLLDYLDSYSLVSQMQRGDWNWTARVAFFALSATGTVFYRCCAPHNLESPFEPQRAIGIRLHCQQQRY